MFESRHRVFAPALALAITAISLVGCDATQDGDASPPPPTEVATARFNLDTGVVPTAIDLLFAPGAGVPLPTAR